MAIAVRRKQTTALGVARQPKGERPVVPSKEAVKQLATHLGRRLLASTLGVDPTSVDRYVRGENMRHDIEQRVMDAHAI